MQRKLLATMLSIILLVSGVLPALAGTSKEIKVNDHVTGAIETTEYEDANSYYLTVKEYGVLTIDANYINRTYRMNINTSGVYNQYIYGFAVPANKTVQYALKPGEYRINVNGTSGAKYDYALSFAEGFQYDAEPNDTYETGVKIPPNTQINGFSDTSLYKNADVYIFEAKQAQKLIVNKKDAEIKVFNAYDSQLIESPTEEASFELDIQPGTYYFEAYGDMYSFSYQFNDVGAFVELEPNNNIMSAQQIDLNTEYSGRISGRTDEIDIYRFTVEEPSLVKFDMGGQKAWVTLYDDEGNHLSTDLDVIDYEVAFKPGTYNLVIRIQHEKETLPYKFILNASPVENASLEPNDTMQQAQPIVLGQQIHQITTTFLQHNNFYRVDIPADGLLTIETSKVNASIVLTSNNPNEHFYMHENPTTHTVSLRKGTYYFNFGVNPQEKSSFVVNFKAMPIEIESNDSKITAQHLPLDEKTRGFLLYPDYLDVWKLQVTEAGNYNVNFDSLDVGLTKPYVRLEDENGNVIANEVALTGTKIVNLKQGDYYVFVSQGSTQNAYDISWQRAAEVLFRDVPIKHSYFNDIMALNKLGIINGYNDKTFKPKDPIKRHHVAAMLVRAKAPAIPEKLTMDFTFKDIAKTHPNFTNVHLLAQGNIINRSGEGFLPNNTITRAQMAKMIVLAFDLQYNEAAQPQTFIDVKESMWHYDYVQVLASHGITTGSNGSFKPNEPLTRQHFAAFLNRALQVVEK